MPYNQDLELAVTAYKTVRDLCAIRQGESLLITIDSEGHWPLAEETPKPPRPFGRRLWWRGIPLPKGTGVRQISTCPTASIRQFSIPTYGSSTITNGSCMEVPGNRLSKQDGSDIFSSGPQH